MGRYEPDWVYTLPPMDRSSNGQPGPRRMTMEMTEPQTVATKRQVWNAGRTVGAKRALKPKQIWQIRFYLNQNRRLRDRALFDLAIDSKLRGCDLVKLRVNDVAPGGARFARRWPRWLRPAATLRSVSRCACPATPPYMAAPGSCTYPWNLKRPAGVSQTATDTIDTLSST